MPLSEEEKRLLRALELSLSEEDPDLASTLSGVRADATDRRVMGLGVLGAIIGMAVVFAGVFTEIAALGIIGFVLMVGCAYLAVSRYQRRGMSPASARGGSANQPKKPSMINRFEDRWNRRQDENG